jgi:hypothetical protein
MHSIIYPYHTIPYHTITVTVARAENKQLNESSQIGGKRIDPCWVEWNGMEWNGMEWNGIK